MIKHEFVLDKYRSQCVYPEKGCLTLNLEDGSPVAKLCATVKFEGKDKEIVDSVKRKISEVIYSLSLDDVFVYCHDDYFTEHIHIDFIAFGIITLSVIYTDTTFYVRHCSLGRLAGVNRDFFLLQLHGLVNELGLIFDVIE